jgi:tRNA dimethylallyltransferase
MTRVPAATPSSALPIVAVVGPTAVGKSDLAVALARRLPGEVVNTDSMQLYRGMDVGTAKLTVEERGGVPHNLLDVLEVTEPASVAEFQRWAREVIADCRDRGVTPVLVGGSALYTRAVLDQFEFPGTDPAVRAGYEAQLAELGAEALHRRLAELDPEAAARIIPTNGRRVVRALEVIELTGRPFSASLPQLEYADPDTVQIGLDCPREVLDERIELRVRRMWDAGLVDEVRRLEAMGLREGRTASRALGYQQVLAHLAGECTEQEAYDATVRGTRRFARRQDSWLRKDPRIHWLPWDAPDLVNRAAALVDSVGEVRGAEPR